MAVYFYYGEEDFNIDLRIEEMKSKLNPDFISMSFQTLNNPNYQQLITILRTPPMMFGDMLAVINMDAYLLSQELSFQDAELEDIEDALKNNPNGLNIMFIVRLPRGEGKKIDSRRKLYKILSKFNTEEFTTFPTYKVAEISNWIKNRAKKKGLNIKSDACELLIEQIGNNLRQFDVELDKLKLMAYPQDTVTMDMVEQISISNQDVFNITELILTNKKDKALLEFKKLTEKEPPIKVLSTIQTTLRKWVILKTKTSASSFELAKLTGWSEPKVKLILSKLKKISAADLVKLNQNLFYAECKIKSAEALDINSEVEIALIR